MPVVELHLIEGYSGEDRQRLCAAMTDAVRLVVPAPPEAVTVMIHEMDAASYMRGRTAKTPAPAQPSPSQVVQDYLAAMEARDLDRAKGYLGDGFQMIFPGTDPMTTLEELIAWSKPRYAFVKKTYEGYDEMQSAGAAAFVYCRGTLFGEWPDGTLFDGIRFIDRFEVTGGKITRQDVWNDIAEVQAQS
ncbi:tautomerase family protein [Phaeobacter marinintestinus]|uniref:tautomerase family protein n=1 Tax=Falsiphaeobacter marinintestinus TaxID=1492905 RepID=UPI0011B5BFB9|nr:tautomerase family protein [Phaeobacter marinintestinus]